MPLYPRRTERINLKRGVKLIFRDRSGRVEAVPATTFAVNCHGAGVYAQHDYPLGAEVFVLDNDSGFGAWGKLVWQGKTMKDGRVPLGVEFAQAKNYWGQRLVPRNWVPFLNTEPAQQTHFYEDKVVITGQRGAATQPAEGSKCLCCGNESGVLVEPDSREPVCQVCLKWAA
jgi:hypothetical protein